MSKTIGSNQSTLPVMSVPKHIAVIMDGNGRWASDKGLPRVWGHKKGVQTVRDAVRACMEVGVEHLTLFAFSSENWRRPPAEVSFLMKLFMRSLRREIKELVENGICFRVVGELSAFSKDIQDLVSYGQKATMMGEKLTLTICANYGGRWDILNAVNQLMMYRVQQNMASDAAVTEEDLKPFLQLSDLPEPDLLIRTGGEERISNFLLWQLAYTELFFTSTYWPDFNKAEFLDAIASYQQRERRFGRTSAQVALNPL